MIINANDSLSVSFRFKARPNPGQSQHIDPLIRACLTLSQHSPRVRPTCSLRPAVYRLISYVKYTSRGERPSNHHFSVLRQSAVQISRTLSRLSLILFIHYRRINEKINKLSRDFGFVIFISNKNSSHLIMHCTLDYPHG